MHTKNLFSLERFLLICASGKFQSAIVNCTKKRTSLLPVPKNIFDYFAFFHISMNQMTGESGLCAQREK